MIPVRLPIPPKGQSAEANWMRQLLAYVRAITPRQTDSVKTDIKTDGAYPHVAKNSGGSGPSITGGARWA